MLQPQKELAEATPSSLEFLRDWLSSGSSSVLGIFSRPSCLPYQSKSWLVICTRDGAKGLCCSSCPDFTNGLSESLSLDSFSKYPIGLIMGQLSTDIWEHLRSEVLEDMNVRKGTPCKKIEFMDEAINNLKKEKHNNMEIKRKKLIVNTKDTRGKNGRSARHP